MHFKKKFIRSLNKNFIDCEIRLINGGQQKRIDIPIEFSHEKKKLRFNWAFTCKFPLVFAPLTTLEDRLIIEDILYLCEGNYTMRPLIPSTIISLYGLDWLDDYDLNLIRKAITYRLKHRQEEIDEYLVFYKSVYGLENLQ